VAQNTARPGGSAIDGRTTRHEGYACEHQVGSTNADLTQGFAGFVPLT
jgi:hypothetical protein